MFILFGFITNIAKKNSVVLAHTVSLSVGKVGIFAITLNVFIAYLLHYSDQTLIISL